MGVVQHLDVVRLGAACEEQREQFLRIGLPGRILFAFAGDAGQRRVFRVHCHVEIVRVGAVIEEQLPDRDRVAVRRRVRESRVAERQ
jgi:hypothetical protein